MFGVRVGTILPASLAATGVTMIAFAVGGLANVDGKLAAEAGDRQPVGLEVMDDRPDCRRDVRL